MKRLGIACVALLFLALPALAQNGTQDEPPPPPDPTEAEYTALELELHEFLDEYGRMWEKRDMDTFDRLIANDPHIVVFGTDAAEYIKGFDAFRQAREAQYEAFDNIEFYVKDRELHVSESGTVAWFTERFDLFTIDGNDEPVMLRDIRLSGVIEKRDGQWQIVQLHNSVPVEGQAAQY